MRTVNNQQVAPGLYNYHVVEKDDLGQESYIGKFVVIG